MVTPGKLPTQHHSGVMRALAGPVAVTLSVTLLSCATPKPEFPCHEELGQHELFYISHPEGDSYGHYVCVSVAEYTLRVQGFPKPVRVRDYVGGGVNDWCYRREWDLDGDGVYDCREDECSKKSPGGHCIARLVHRQWRDDRPDVQWCVDPKDWLPFNGPNEGATPQP